MPRTQKSITVNSARNHIVIRRTRRTDAKSLLLLIDALADYEKLKRPTRIAKERLIRDGFRKKKRFDSYLAFCDGVPVGYIIIFETYSSFKALPTLYLEDLFVLSEYRNKKIGLKLFQTCVKEAIRRGCGRLEWVVLDWNKLALRFYDTLGAKHLKEWYTYRLDRKQFSRLLR